MKQTFSLENLGTHFYEEKGQNCTTNICWETSHYCHISCVKNKLPHSLTQLLTSLFTHSLTYFLLTYLLTHLLTYSLTSYLLTYLPTYLLTYLLTPWRRVFLQKLNGSQLVKKFPAFYGPRDFITAFKRARHLSLSWARSIQSMSTIPLLEDSSSMYQISLPFSITWVAPNDQSRSEAHASVS